jgi:hypothetical protein
VYDINDLHRGIRAYLQAVHTDLLQHPHILGIAIRGPACGDKFDQYRAVEQDSEIKISQGQDDLKLQRVILGIGRYLITRQILNTN